MRNTTKKRLKHVVWISLNLITKKRLKHIWSIKSKKKNFKTISLLYLEYNEKVERLFINSLKDQSLSLISLQRKGKMLVTNRFLKKKHVNFFFLL